MNETSTNEPVILAKNLNKTFSNEVRALRDFSLSVDHKEVVVIIGPSGSGKSTFLRCLNGLETIDSGSIRIAGTPLDHKKKHRDEIRKEVGMVFQLFNLFGHLTVQQNIDLAQRRVRGKSKEQAKAMTMELLAKVGMSHKADSYPNQLSGGQQQRVAIARAWPCSQRSCFSTRPPAPWTLK